MTKFNHRLDLYVSPVQHPDAWAVVTLSFPWKEFLGYAFPLIPILGKVVGPISADPSGQLSLGTKICSCYLSISLLSYSADSGKISLIQPRFGFPHGNPAALNLHAWLLYGATCAHRVLQIE